MDTKKISSRGSRPLSGVSLVCILAVFGLRQANLLNEYTRHNWTTEPLLYHLWQDENFSYVETAKFVHSYNSDASVRVTSYPQSLQSTGSSAKSPLQSIDDHPTDDKLTLRAVYYVNTKINANYGTWIRNQLLILPPIDELYIVADANNCTKEDSLRKAFKWLKTNRTESIIKLDCHNTNGTELYEFHGIYKIWQLGQRYPGRNDIGIYFHSKGLTHAPNWKEYRNPERVLDLKMEDVFGEAAMERVQEAFQLFPDVDIVGQECGFSKSPSSSTILPYCDFLRSGVWYSEGYV
jgi:hypothetical protein